jgi:hypothetical protein
MISQGNVVMQRMQVFEHLEFYHLRRHRYVGVIPESYVLVNFNVRVLWKPEKCNTCYKLNENTVRHNYKYIVKQFFVYITCCKHIFFSQ